MTVRKVNDGIPAPTKGTPAAPGGTLVDALTRTGLLTGGKDPAKVAAQLLGNLVAMGFGAGVGHVEAALKASIAAFQRAQGLPVTGLLDQATANAMSAQGLLPGQGVHRFQDGFEKRAEKRPSTEDVTTTPNAGQGGLATKLGETLSGLIGGLFGARGAREPSEGKQGSASEPSPSDKKGRADDGATTATGHAATSSASEKARADARGLVDPTMRGVREGDPDALRGRASSSEGGARSGDTGKASGARKKGEHDDGAVDGDPDGSESERGNASSGDDDFDEREGHASSDDGSAAARGHWRVLPVDVQAQRALDAIKKEPDVENRAALYSLDVHFYRPGVYAAGQKGDELLHIVVTGASAADPVWETVAARVAALVERHAPGRLAPDIDDFRAALRVARYRTK